MSQQQASNTLQTVGVLAAQAAAAVVQFLLGVMTFQRSGGSMSQTVLAPALAAVALAAASARAPASVARALAAVALAAASAKALAGARVVPAAKVLARTLPQAGHLQVEKDGWSQNSHVNLWLRDYIWDKSN
eukprot:TRINITY_DN5931_c0_g1_i2.p1 TRINITY_DN5931_c0_g1~~TRINITY_DN5931_c0_g1_i2.p1  ORF type:complete len:144 (+),score=34.14 TRINITY_DN5931_c0_g1_i2:37-432(+)